MEEITVKGMTCQHCVNHVTETLTAMGLSGVKVDLDSGQASYNNASSISTEAIKKAVDQAGYQAEEA